MKLHVNGIDLYYEKTGQGPPLLMMHGNGETHAIFHRAVKQLRDRFTVYAIDTRAHGRSSRVKPLHYADMAEDIAQLINALGLKKPFFYGFSDGGIVGLMLAFTYPQLLSRLAVSGASLTPSSSTDATLRFFRIMYKLTRGAKWKLMLDEPQITPEQLAKIEVPTLVLAGEKDMIKEEHTRIIAASVPGARLKILPGEGHASYIMYSTKFCKLITPFFLEDI